MMPPPTSVTIITAPYHVGIPSHRVGRGPNYLLKDCKLVDRLTTALGPDVPITVQEIYAVKEIPTQVEGDIGRSFAVLRNISAAVSEAVRRGSWPLVLGGNCMGVVGVSAGLCHGGDNVDEVIWFDAHGDLETPETTMSGYLDGLGGAMLLGEGFESLLRGVEGWRKIEGRQLLGVGMRSVSEAEEERIVKDGVRIVRGGYAIDGDEYAREVGRALKQTDDLKDTVVHLDVDVLDSSIGKANDFAMEGGLGTKDLVECMQVIGKERSVKAMHVASFDPVFEGRQEIAEAAIKAILEVVSTVFASTKY